MLDLMKVNRNEPRLLHEQVADQIRHAIAAGEAAPGERIPKAKDLAVVLGVNTNTVLRSLHLLRDEGLLEVGRGRAIVVAGTPERSDVIVKAKALSALARERGFSKQELLELIDEVAWI